MPEVHDSVSETSVAVEPDVGLAVILQPLGATGPPPVLQVKDSDEPVIVGVGVPVAQAIWQVTSVPFTTGVKPVGHVERALRKRRRCERKPDSDECSTAECIEQVGRETLLVDPPTSYSNYQSIIRPIRPQVGVTRA